MRTTTTYLPSLPILLLLLQVGIGIFWISSPLLGQDYIISLDAGSLVITDVAGNGDQLDIGESGDSIRFEVVGRTYSFNEGPPTAFPFVNLLTGIDAISISTESGNDMIFLGAFMTPMPALTINGGEGDDQINLTGDINFVSGANFNLDLQNDHASPGSDVVIMSDTSDLMLSGTGEAILKVSRNILIGTGCSIVTEDGNLTIEANQQTIPTIGTFIGIVVNGGLIKVSGSGMCTVKGRGGTSATFQYGIHIHTAGKIIGGLTGLTNVIGNGGLSTLASNYGIYLSGMDSKITSFGGDVLINGTGGGTGTTSSSNHGVNLSSGAEISAGGNAQVSVVGQGGNAAVAGNSNHGVYVNSAETRIRSGGGNVSVVGTGGGFNNSFNNHGVFLFNAGQITAGGNGTVTVTGTGGNPAGTGGTNHGVHLNFNAAGITSEGGPVLVTGYGGGSASAANNFGVYLSSSGVITAGGTGSVTVEGTGGQGAGGSNRGVSIINVLTTITSSGGNVEVTGLGGGSSTSTIGSTGVYMSDGEISAGGTGEVNITGTAGTGGGVLNHGIFMISSSIITSSGGPVTVTGHAGNHAGEAGINITSPSSISTLNNGGNVTLKADIMSLSASVMTDEDHAVYLLPVSAGRNIDLGSSEDPVLGPLCLSDIEINGITTGTLVIGGSDCDTLRVSADINRAVAVDMELQSTGDIIIDGGLINTGGGSLLLYAGASPAAVWASMSGIDVIANELTLSNDLGISIDGITVDAEYDQLNVIGAIDLTDVNLVFDGLYVPEVGDTFIIVKNDDIDLATGTFAGLPEGAIINDFFANGMGLNAVISYVGGDGNDVKIEVIGLGPNTWLGSISSAWNDPLNWSRGIVPSYDTDVLVRLASNSAVIQVDEEAFAKSLEVETGATLHVYGNLNLLDN